MERYHFTSTLLVPAPEYAGKDFRWIDTITGQHSNGNTEKVDVLVFNVKEKGEIKPMFEHELERLKKLDAPAEIDTRTIVYIENILQEMESGNYEHKAPEALMKAISNSAHKAFTADDVIYLSGISHIIN